MRSILFKQSYISLILLPTILFALSSCSAIYTDWPPEEEKVVAVIGPINSPDTDKSYEKARLLGLAIDDYVNAKRAGDSPQIKRLNWINYYKTAQKIWDSLEALKYKKGELSIEEEAGNIFETYEEEFPFSHLIFLRVNQEINLDHSFKVEFYRIIVSNEDYAEINYGSVWVDRQKGNVNTQLKALLDRLFSSKNRATPSFGTLGFSTIPEGCFKSRNQKVCVNTFHLSRFPVTQSQWQNVMGYNPSKNLLGGLYPVENISWEQANRFIQKLNESSPFQYRLPTRDELEYVCHAGGADQSTGNVAGVDKIAGDTWLGTSPVGRFSPDGFGLHDIKGGVREWTLDKEVVRFENPVSKFFHRFKTFMKEKVTRGATGSSFTFNGSGASCIQHTVVHKKVGAADIGIRLVVEY